ncbi:MAG: DNA-binding transcriptional regulator, partial [Rhodospirillales bacterium]|nr:DNA-binding transcriptional regulator [Rhodospirillales bacterium]
AIRSTRLPAVDTHSAVIDHGLPLVYPNERDVGRLAMEHFRDRGFKCFAFCAMTRERWVDWRRAALLEQVNRAGYACHDVKLPRHSMNWEQQRDTLAQQIKALDKPVAILASNDVCGLRVLDACRHAGVHVPEQAAVLGVDNDKTLCRLADPPLSSISLNVERIGYEAAALLDRMMRNRRAVPKRPRWIAPAGIEARCSTDVLAIDDPLVAAALRWIRQHATRGASVRDLVRALPTNRRTLEQRFNTVLGRTPKQQLMRERLEYARRLLLATTLPISHVAEQMGYGSLNYFSTMFKRETGFSPLEYRNKWRF